MIDNLLKKLNDYHLMDWGVILQGWKGVPGLSIKVKAADIAKFAIEELSHVEGSLTNIFVQLASAECLDEDEITNLLEKLCEKKNINLEVSLRKWRLIMLEELLNNISNDPIYDLINITEFWLSWENPPESPHIIQGVGNALTPNQYYSEENLENIVDVHRVWVAKEMQELNSSQKD